MVTLATDKPRAFEHADFNEIPVVATDIIYEGAAVGLDGSGNARPLVAGDQFVGFAESKVDNSAGAAGDKNVRVRERGKIELSVTGVTAATDVGDSVYASDDDTFTLTPSTNSRIGKVHRFVSGTTVVVKFQAQKLASEITDTADATYSANEQTMLDNLKATVNILIDNQAE